VVFIIFINLFYSNILELAAGCGGAVWLEKSVSSAGSSGIRIEWLPRLLKRIIIQISCFTKISEKYLLN
jgi:hypothetical protein